MHASTPSMAEQDSMSGQCLRVAAMISGAGRTVRALHQTIRTRQIPIRIGVVIAHDQHLPGVQSCREIGLDVEIVAGSPSGETSSLIDQILLDHETELVCLCGYLRKFRVGERWKNRVINMHPALLPDFGGKGMYGRRVHEAVITAQSSRSGCTVHWVDEEYDHGEHILQKSCPVHKTDDPDSLANRVFELECEAYPEALRMISESRVAASSSQGGHR